jgi:hypothetical protein
MPHCLRCERLGATCYGYSEDLPRTPEEMSERTGDAVSRLRAVTNEAIEKQANLYATAAQQRSSGEEDTLDEPRTPKRSKTSRRSRQDTLDEPTIPKRSKDGRRSREDTLDEPWTPKHSETDRRSRWETISPTVSEEREDSLKYGGIGKEAWLEMGGMSRSGGPRTPKNYSRYSSQLRLTRAFGSRT